MTDNRCPAESRGVQCQLVAGHDGAHLAGGELPPDIAPVFAAIMDEYEMRAEQARTAARYYRRAMWGAAAAVALNIGAAVYYLVRIATS